MNTTALTLHGKGTSNGAELSPRNVPLNIVAALAKNLPAVIAGDNVGARRVIEDGLSFDFAEGSLIVNVVLAATAAVAVTNAGFDRDLAAIAVDRIEEVGDSSRIKALREIQKVFADNGVENLEIASPLAKVEKFTVSERSFAQTDTVDAWVDAERYIAAKVTDIGGKREANAHLELAGGETIKVDSSQSYLGGLTDNLLYKTVLAHVSYRMNPKTGAEKDFKLIDFLPMGGKFDRAEFDKSVADCHGWDAVEDVEAEVRRLRGADA